MLLVFKDIPKKPKTKVTVNKPPVIWNTNKKGGWVTYYNKTNENMKLDAVASNAVKAEDVETLMNEIDKTMRESKYKSFGKVTFRKTSEAEK